MFYTVYKVRNEVNGKVYIGKHKTKNLKDSYMGSGNLLRHAIKKYGVENFTKVILHVFDNEKDMNLKEFELVDELFRNVVPCYNLKFGGEGGFDYINTTRTKESRLIAVIKGGIALQELLSNDPVKRKAHSDILSEKMKSRHKERSIAPPTFAGRTHSAETKERMSNSAPNRKGQYNSQYGTCWVTCNGVNKKVKKDNLMVYTTLGWERGRV